MIELEGVPEWRKHDAGVRDAEAKLREERAQMHERGMADHELIDDLKRKSFAAVAPLDDAIVLGPRLRATVASRFRGLAPLVDYLCAALDLEF